MQILVDPTYISLGPSVADSEQRQVLLPRGLCGRGLHLIIQEPTGSKGVSSPPPLLSWAPPGTMQFAAVLLGLLLLFGALLHQHGPLMPSCCHCQLLLPGGLAHALQHIAGRCGLCSCHSPHLCSYWLSPMSR